MDRNCQDCGTSLSTGQGIGRNDCVVKPTSFIWFLVHIPAGWGTLNSRARRVNSYGKKVLNISFPKGSSSKIKTKTSPAHNAEGGLQLSKFSKGKGGIRAPFWQALGAFAIGRRIFPPPFFLHKLIQCFYFQTEASLLSIGGDAHQMGCSIIWRWQQWFGSYVRLHLALRRKWKYLQGQVLLTPTPDVIHNYWSLPKPLTELQ